MADPRFDHSSPSPDQPSVRWRHDLVNLVLAARLRVDALRASEEPAGRTTHLDALDAALARIARLAVSGSDGPVAPPSTDRREWGERPIGDPLEAS
jgi:hypothetical protein